MNRARLMVAGGKGDERAMFNDFEGSKGMLNVHTTAAVYLTWFDPDGAMNQLKSSQALPTNVPVLFVAPTDDYPGLKRTKHTMFGALPRNPLTRLYEPDADHLNAPVAAIDEIMRWTAEVTGK
ncbi:MAG: hypothetical protein ACO3HA_07675 [Burkholderiales bacterium]